VVDIRQQIEAVLSPVTGEVALEKPTESEGLGAEREINEQEDIDGHPGPEAVKKTESSADATDEPQPTSPACNKCGEAMVLRKARSGKLAGHAFWGCSAFPKCRGTRKC